MAFRPGTGWTGFLTRSGFHIEEGGNNMAMSATMSDAYKVAEQVGRQWRGDPSEQIPFKVNLEHKVVDALMATGFLRTGIEERAVAACREYRRREVDLGFENGVPLGTVSVRDQSGNDVSAVGRDILAAETPKPRYEVGEVPGGSYRPFYVSDREATSGSGARIAKFTNRDDAYNYANAKNREDK